MTDAGERRGQRWHFDRHVSIGHLLTTAAVVVSVVLWLTDVDKRVSLTTQAVAAAERRSERIEARQAAALIALKAEIRDGFTAVRTDLRVLAERVDRQRGQTASTAP